jgi:hypothetical protein
MMKKRSVKKVQDIDRSFVAIPEVSPDHWRESLELFFDDNDTGLDHMRYLKEMSHADIDNYYFTSGYEIYHLFPQEFEVNLRIGAKKSKKIATRMGTFSMVYQSTGCFRYAMPEEHVKGESAAS